MGSSSLLFIGYLRFFPMVKRPKREVNDVCMLPWSKWVELHFCSPCMSLWREQWRLYIPLTLSCSDLLTVGFIFKLSSLILLIGNCRLVWWLRIPSIVAEKNHATPHLHQNANVSHAESEIAVTAIASNKKPKPQRKVAGTSFRHLICNWPCV